MFDYCWQLTHEFSSYVTSGVTVVTDKALSGNNGKDKEGGVRGLTSTGMVSENGGGQHTAQVSVVKPLHCDLTDTCKVRSLTGVIIYARNKLDLLYLLAVGEGLGQSGW